jgi:hypothetical protein
VGAPSREIETKISIELGASTEYPLIPKLPAVHVEPEKSTELGEVKTGVAGTAEAGSIKFKGEIKMYVKQKIILALTRLIFPPEYKLNWIQFIKITLKFKIYYEFLSSFMMPATESCI